MSAELFAARLRELRAARNWTQGELAAAAKVSARAVAQWEQGLRQPSWENVIALADALGVSTEAFRQEPTQPEAEKRKAGRPKAQPAAEAEQAPTEQTADAPKKKPRKK